MNRGRGAEAEHPEPDGGLFIRYNPAEVREAGEKDRAPPRSCRNEGRKANAMNTDPRYPIGKFKYPAAIDAGARNEFIAQIAAAPSELREALKGLDDRQLDTPYREGGWTVFDFFTEWKTVYVDYSGKLQRAQIDT